MSAIPDAAIDIVTRWEGLKLKAYLCPAGVWTIGYGSTGPNVVKGLVITKAQALALLRADLEVAADRILTRIGPVVTALSDNQYAALISFVFNLGANPQWTIWKVLKAKAFDQVPTQLMRFIKARDPDTGQLITLKGLVNRRTDEVKLWTTPDEDEPEVIMPSGTTREVETPPAPMEKPAATSRSFVASAVTAGAAVTAAVPQGIEQVNKAVAPYADKSEWVGNLVAILSGVAAACAIAALVFLWLKQRNGRL
jgi:lysozyme